MLQITVPETEFYDEIKEEFVTYKAQVLQLEHSLVSISKWEAYWNKPFLTDNEKSYDELTHYVKCMTITQNVKDDVFGRLTKQNVDDINKYIESPMTATTFSDQKQSPNREIITSEIIYYWMVTFNIPFECQKWHLNRLLTLVKVCNIKSNPPKKMGRQELAQRNRELNAARKAKLNTRG